ncbi:MAG TPA: hypothetical protein PKJ25_05705 [Smithellaceae bacterium]|nr:hypothetical protein [Smithellaceae bacterium]
MENDLTRLSSQANRTRYLPGQKKGHYESFFQRANHPARPLAFWIRYTIFSPRNAPQNALGELWAVFFNGETNRHVAAKKEVAFQECAFAGDKFFVKIASAVLEKSRLTGAASSGGHEVSWNLSFTGAAEPLFLLPPGLYDKGFPKAKSLVGVPNAVYNRLLHVDGEEFAIKDWIGSQNHNWGSKHTDDYAWGQVAGFDNNPDSFLEVATARVKVGPFWTPYMTPLVLRYRGEEIALNSLTQMFRAEGAFDYFTWKFRSANDSADVEGTIKAPKEVFVGLNYYNPPGGSKYCLNTKIASCQLKLNRKIKGKSAEAEILSTKHRAAFEILTNDSSHGIKISA